jgi:hypothetical protein
MVMALDIQLKNIKGLRNMMNMVVSDTHHKNRNGYYSASNRPFILK